MLPLHHILFFGGVVFIAVLSGFEAWAKVREWSIDIRRAALERARKDAWKKAHERD